MPGTYYVVIEGQYAGDMDIDIAEVQGPCDGAVLGPGVRRRFHLVPPPYAELYPRFQSASAILF